MTAGPEPGTPEHTRLVTASKVAAIVGCGRPKWGSPRQMWHLMRGDIPEIGDNAAEKHRGHLLEPAVLEWWRQQHPNAYGFTYQPWMPLDAWGGARPDLVIEDDGSGTPAVVEAKSDGHSDHWGTPGTDEIPLDYAVQVQWQMGIAGVTRAYVPMIGPRLAFAEYVVQFDPAVFAWLKSTTWGFYRSLTDGSPPPLDDTEATLACMRRLHADIDGESVELDPDVAAELRAAHAGQNEARARYRAASSTVLEAMGTARYGMVGEDMTARRQPSSRGGVALYVTTPKERGTKP